MSLATNYVKTQNEMFVFTFNEVVQGTDANGNPTTQYQPLTIECRMDALTQEGAPRGVVEKLGVGILQNQPLTQQQIYNRLNAFAPQIATLYKQTVLAAIDTDVSA